MKIERPPLNLSRISSRFDHWRMVTALTAAIGLSSGLAISQTDESAAMETIRASKNLPGLSVLVLKQGHVVAQGAAGVRRIGNSSHLNISDRVNFGSCTKFITATVAARLVDKGQIAWTTQIKDVFPNYASFNPAFQTITLDDILSHRAGIQQQTTFDAKHWNALQSVGGSITTMRAWVCNTVLSDPPDVPQGTFLYANQGFTVAAGMLELASGKSWEQLVQDEVFTPLRMTSATMGITYDDSPVPLGVVGHDLAAGATVAVPRPAPSASILQHYQASNGPGGYVVCTLADYAKFLHAQVTGETGTYVSTASHTHLITPWTGTGGVANGYAKGVYAVAGQPWAAPGLALNHAGDIFGEDTDFWAAPGKDFVIVIFTNALSQDSRSNDAMNSVAVAMINAFSNTTVTTASGPLLEYPEISATSKASGTFSLTANTLPVISYQLQRSSNLQTWTDTGTAKVASDWNTAFSATTTLTKEYFRIKVLP